MPSSEEKSLCELERELKNNRVGVELGEVLRDLPLAVSIVERVVDQLWRNAESPGLVAVDRDLDLWRVCQKIGRRVRDLRQRAHFFEHLLRPLGQLLDVRTAQRILEAAARRSAADGNVLGGR